ncbi:hypothetical protein [Pedobacter nyackensis]|nr:hypothetical protein [Pedobacter nyackensis]
MKNLLLFLALPMFFFASCENRGEWVISDVSKDTLLIAETRVKTPTALLLEISGHVNDSIEVRGVRLPGGKIQEKFRLDHYYPKVAVQFKSYKATKGSLRIKYHVPSIYDF